MMKKNAGFTLIEIMLVLVLMALGSVAVITTLPDSRQDLAKEQAQRFFYRLQLLNEDAILNGKDFGIRFDAKKHSYTYLVLQAEGWVLYEDKTYALTELPEGVELKYSLGGDAWANNESFFNQESLFDQDMFAEFEDEDKPEEPPQIFVMSSGEITPFTLNIYPERELDEAWLVVAEESGVITLYKFGEAEE